MITRWMNVPDDKSWPNKIKIKYDNSWNSLFDFNLDFELIVMCDYFWDYKKIYSIMMMLG